MHESRWIEALGISEARYRETVVLPRAERRIRLERVQARDGRLEPLALRWPQPLRWAEVWLRCG